LSIVFRDESIDLEHELWEDAEQLCKWSLGGWELATERAGRDHFDHCRGVVAGQDAIHVSGIQGLVESADDRTASLG
jgi:hypothetical protein